MRGSNNKNNLLAQAAQTLYGTRKQEEDEKEKIRNSLLNELGDKLSPAQILYSSNEELQKIKEETNKETIEIPLPKINNKQISETQNDNKLFFDTQKKQEIKLKDKIVLDENKEVSENNQALFYNDENDEAPFKLNAQYNDYVGLTDNSENASNNSSKMNNTNVINSSVKQNNGKDDTPTIQNEIFNNFMKHIYKTEGGFSDNPNDRGGRTNFGITQAAYNSYNKRHGLPVKDVKNITKKEADTIYYYDFYKASGADKIKDPYLSYVHFDAAINHGPGIARRLYKQSGDDFNKYIEARRKFYRDIVKQKPVQKKFLKGWMNRMDRIEKMKYGNQKY